MASPTRYGVAPALSHRGGSGAHPAGQDASELVSGLQSSALHRHKEGAVVKSLSTILVAVATLLGVVAAASLTSTGLVFAEPQVSAR